MPTPTRSIRIPDDLWTYLQARADERGMTVSKLVVAILTRSASRGAK